MIDDSLVPDITDLNDVRTALQRVVRQTPLERNHTLSELVGCEVYLKAELFQKTGSYKPRGMYWALNNLPKEQRQAGAITFSAGNAAQGLAYAGSLLDIPCTVVMPETASSTKSAATKAYGAEVILHGNPSECLAHCKQLASDRGLAFISSYDDVNLMLGHASLGLEILEVLPDADVIFVGIGGGGMAGGLALSIAASGKNLRLFGVEPERAAAMHESLRKGHAVALDNVNTIADGLAAPTAGRYCYEVLKGRLEDVLLVTDDQIVKAMKLLMARAKLFVEPAGAAALAGLLSMRGAFRPETKIVCIISGGNMDFDRLAQLLQGASDV